MAYNTKKYLDEEGLKQVVRLLDEYPDNQILGTVIDEIQDELDKKADVVSIPEVPVQDVQVNGTSILNNGIANVPLARIHEFGVISTNGAYGLNINNGILMTTPAPESVIKPIYNNASEIMQQRMMYRPITAKFLNEAVFYGLAKAAGDTTQSQSSNTVGTYTNEAKAAIQNMLDVPAKADIPNVPVQDVQINGTSVIQNGVAEIPVAGADTYGTVKVERSSTGIELKTNGVLGFVTASDANCKTGSIYNRIVAPSNQHSATFYGLAKAAGYDEKNSAESLGTYTPEAKGAIQKMLGVSDLIATEENNLVASKAYAVGDVFTANGKLYKATAAIAVDGAIITDGANANCEETNIGEGFVKKTDYATSTSDGIVKVSSDGTYGIRLNRDNVLFIYNATYEQIKNGGVNWFNPIVPSTQHYAAFYGLAKAAGDATQSASDNDVGTYTDEAKQAIQQMLGVDTTTVNVTGTTPTITAQSNHRYICGEVTSIDFTPCIYGICELMFTSGSTLAVLTLPSTVKMPEWFEVETEKIYDIIITDGVYGAVMSWEI